MTNGKARHISRLVDTKPSLRFGWTTGACAAAAAKAAFTALLTGDFPDPVEITLPRGHVVAFALAETGWRGNAAMAAIVKDAGDDPDVTHGALVRAIVIRAPPGSGIAFRAGEGIGTVSRPGLPVPPGEPAINPIPRQMIRDALAAANCAPADAIVEISIPGGAAIAERTLNGRLGIIGGLSILGTTGIVVPYSCSAWIHGIRSGIDVARATSLPHIAGATGRTSERAVQALHNLPEAALIDMGDFVGGMLKYLRTHPIPRVTVAGGVAKITKLAQGRLDLHSKRGAVDMAALADLAEQHPELAARIRTANTAAEAFSLAAGTSLGDAIAARAWQVAAAALDNPQTALEVVMFDREARILGRAPFAPSHAEGSGRNLRR
ncbi:MAG TPA: cobalt-precorrin-5B (C(1))-methyltransferase [Acetobacteraceae bacterium]|jgi:cobalt-precorrin-5B (C1)-methyltransferase